MPSLALLAPVALPLVAGGVTAALGLAGLKPGRAIVGAGAWAALARPSSPVAPDPLDARS